MLYEFYNIDVLKSPGTAAQYGFTKLLSGSRHVAATALSLSLSLSLSRSMYLFLPLSLSPSLYSSLSLFLMLVAHVALA
jgi:hypothetical protein